MGRPVVFYLVQSTVFVLLYLIEINNKCYTVARKSWRDFTVYKITRNLLHFTIHFLYTVL